MKKEEKIKEAWGIYLPKNGVSENGWSQCLFDVSLIDINIFDTRVIGNELVSIRPKSLQGIENNNGWIKIESEADLPKDGWHWTLSIIENEPFQTHYEDIDIRYHTHYQPIIKPLKPIY